MCKSTVLGRTAGKSKGLAPLFLRLPPINGQVNCISHLAAYWWRMPVTFK